MEIFVCNYDGHDIAKSKIEIVERKGLGHPDSICDHVMNQVSIALTKEYIKEFKSVMHFNADKSLLVAGSTEKSFNGGKVIHPMLLVMGDRATFKVGNKEIYVEKIAINAAKEWIKNNLYWVNPGEHIKYQIELKHGSEELRDIFNRKGKVLGAGDTSAAVGFAPLTKLEESVFSLENYLNSKKFKKQFPETGTDIKVMGVRNNSKFHFTTAIAFVDRFIKSEDDYFRKKNEVMESAKEFLKSKGIDGEIDINTLDAKGRGINGVYLTVLGTSAEDGDCGQVGRGNRVNGIIPLMRPGSTEAAAGKNPVSHVGKIYNLLSFDIANQIYKETGCGAYVWLVSQIGVSIDKPLLASAQLIDGDEKSLKQANEIISKRLENISDFTNKLIKGEVTVC